nr:hypothetical protein [Campylobacter jejuni]
MSSRHQSAVVEIGRDKK